jgi:PAS domain S-box-containing protein
MPPGMSPEFFDRPEDEGQSPEGRDPAPRPVNIPNAGLSPEALEREAAWARGESRARMSTEEAASSRAGHDLLDHPGLIQGAFAALADNVRDYAIFLMDPEGVVIFWGEGARLIKWWTKDQCEGGHLRLLYPEGGSEDGTAEEHLVQAAETGEYTGQGHRIRNDLSTFWAGVTLTALRGAEGELLGFAKVTRDLTARRAAEAAARASLNAAEEASHLKSVFLATMSHEIRTPLNAIMAYTDILNMEMGGPLTDTQRDQLRKIRVSSQHLLGLVEEVLDLSRIEAGRMVVARDKLRLGDVISQALMLVEPQSENREIELVDAVSGFSAELFCWGDEERLRQILLNLLSNALKFTPRGGQVTVSAGAAEDPSAEATLMGGGPWVYIRVEDTGPGIPRSRLDAIFEPFVQGDMSLTREHGGTGLGLSISRRLARLMGGDITVRSQEGIGSTFFLWLHAAPDETATPMRDQERTVVEPSAGSLRDVRDAILAELERVLHAYVARLRSDEQVPGAKNLSEAELEDHLASFLADLAQTLGSMDLAEGVESSALRDGTAIQRVIAERHGRQRADLGWSESEVRREFQVLKEELAAAVQRRIERPRREEVVEAIEFVNEFLDRAEKISLAGLRAQHLE